VRVGPSSAPIANLYRNPPCLPNSISSPSKGETRRDGVPGRVGGGVAPAAGHRSVRARLTHPARLTVGWQAATLSVSFPFTAFPGSSWSVFGPPLAEAADSSTMRRLLPSAGSARLAFPCFRHYETRRLATNLPTALPFGSIGRTTPGACFRFSTQARWFRGRLCCFDERTRRSRGVT
jgi:hypothetical protein